MNSNNNGPSSAAAAAHDNELSNLFGSLEVGRHHNPFGKKKTRSVLAFPVSHSRATRSTVRSGKASLVPPMASSSSLSQRRRRIDPDGLGKKERKVASRNGTSRKVNRSYVKRRLTHKNPKKYNKLFNLP